MICLEYRNGRHPVESRRKKTDGVIVPLFVEEIFHKANTGELFWNNSLAVEYGIWTIR